MSRYLANSMRIPTSRASYRALSSTVSRGTIKHAPGWKEELASNSESAVKADREPHSGMDDLRKRSVDHLHGKAENTGEIEHAPGWDHSKSSNSEASVKADKEDVDHQNIDKLQKSSAEKLKHK